MSFDTKLIAFFGAKSRCVLPRSRSPAKAMRCADATLFFQAARYGLRNDRTFSINISTEPLTIKHSDSPSFVSTLCCNTTTRLCILVSIKSSFYAQLLRKCDVIDNFFNHSYQIFLILTHFHCYVTMIHFAVFAANVFSIRISQKLNKLDC